MPHRLRRTAGLLTAAAVASAVAGCSPAAEPASARTEDPVLADAEVVDFSTADGDTSIVVPYGICAIDWTVIGGLGAEGADGEAPEPPIEVRTTRPVSEGEEFELAVGGRGGDPAGDLERWQGGFNPADAQAYYNGADGDREQGGGGGGAASVVEKFGGPYIVAAGGAGGGPGGGPGGKVVDPWPKQVVRNPDRDYSGATKTEPTTGLVSGTYVPCSEPQGPGRPTDVVVTPGVARLTVTWGPPVSAGPTPVESYEVHAVARLENGPVDGETACTVPAAENSCELVVNSSHEYRVDVVAIDTEGRRGAVAAVYGRAEPVPVPDVAPDGEPLPTGPLDGLAAGAPVEIAVSGYLPRSGFHAVLYPTQASLTGTLLDENGAYAGPVHLPEELPPGRYSLVVIGVDPAGEIRYQRADVTV